MASKYFSITALLLVGVISIILLEIVIDIPNQLTDTNRLTIILYFLLKSIEQCGFWWIMMNKIEIKLNL